jgi:DeoR/GlpR family transcriptional regulator of sugar metabolism
MLANQRRDKIFDLLKDEGSAKVIDLAKLFKVTEVTVRQDLEKLERDGLLVREHGGAFIKSTLDQKVFGSGEKDINIEKKEIIATKCLEFIHHGDTIILDSGTTTTEIAKKLKGNKRVTVITNALNIAMLLGGMPDIEVIMTGGELQSDNWRLGGQKAADFFKGVNAQTLFMTATGLSLKGGITCSNFSDTVVKKAMIHAAEKSYVVADSSKMGKTGLASLGGLSVVNGIVTDAGMNPNLAALFSNQQVELIVAN